MMNFGALNWFDSFVKKLKKSIELYQPRDLYLCLVFMYSTILGQN